MTKSPNAKPMPACGCKRTCRCQRELRCRCHDLNALLALTLWDYGRRLRRKNPPVISP